MKNVLSTTMESSCFRRPRLLFSVLLVVGAGSMAYIKYLWLFPVARLVPMPAERGASRTPVLEVVDHVLLAPNSSLGDPGQGTPQRPVLMLKAQRPGANGSESSERVDVAVSLTDSSWRELRSGMKEAETAMFPWQLPKERRVDCHKVFDGDRAELELARHTEQNTRTDAMKDKVVGSLAASCPSFKKKFAFITSSLTEEERDFPIAYSVLVFKEAAQVVNLLRTIYRPQNYYCLHVDNKSRADFRKSMSAVAACFPNVFLSSRSVNVRWGTWTVLEPELICMRDLWRHKKWQYLINLTGQEFPLKTNYELVKILTAFRGANNLEGTRKRVNVDRWRGLAPAPWGIIPTKGSVHITVNRDFVDFILHTRVARDFLQWARRAKVPDEVFFATLNHNPHLGIRGTYRGEPETHSRTYPFLTRFKVWSGSRLSNFTCTSKKWVRNICILSSGDLPSLASRPELFANKFYADKSRVALGCLADRIFNRTRDQYLGRLDFDASFYARQPFVRNMVNTSTFHKDL